ncbi:hypothetical protein [Afipia sp. P52-10]|uniref:hypothetical protein n=1 Tax=Afipia sp. P52-10 TaxID=1429916 RepID=UPI00126843B8|nr:hypothetical protein [Afipia sp. P52-10]
MLHAFKLGHAVMVGRDAGSATILLFDDEREASAIFHCVKQFNEQFMNGGPPNVNVDALATTIFGERIDKVSHLFEDDRDQRVSVLSLSVLDMNVGEIVARPIGERRSDDGSS